MNKSEMIDQIAASADLSKAAAGRAPDATIAAVQTALKKGGTVTLVGFGSFSVVDRAPRTGRNPKTGETVPIPSRRVVRFRPGKELADKIQ